MNIRQARKIADLAAPGSRQSGRDAYPRRIATMVRAFYRTRRKWRSQTTASNAGDNIDAGRKCTEDYFRGNRLASRLRRHRVKVPREVMKPTSGPAPHKESQP